jgi:hypothetical protein
MGGFVYSAVIAKCLNCIACLNVNPYSQYVCIAFGVGNAQEEAFDVWTSTTDSIRERNLNYIMMRCIKASNIK